MSSLVIPDTNVLLHFRMFDDLPWPDVVGTDDLVLVIMWPIVRELDKLKSDPRLRDRARSLLSRIEDLFAEGDNAVLRSGLKTEFQHCRTLRETLLAHGLDATIGDDLVLAGVLSLQNVNDNIIIVTDDAGMRLRARAHGIAVRPVPQDLRITSTDPLAAENAKLKRQVDELTSALPKLELKYVEGGDLLDIGRAEPPQAGSRGTADVLRFQPLSLDKLPFIYKFQLGRPTQAEVDEYNEQLEQFRATFTEYLQQRDAFELFPHESIPIQLVLRNSGGRPADEVKLSLRFPVGVTAVSETDVPKEPKCPEGPELPGRPRGIYAHQRRAATMAASATISSAHALVSHSIEPIRLWSRREPRGPDISMGEDGSTEVGFYIPLLSNFDEVSLPLFYAKFQAPQKVVSFGFSYSIRTHSLPRLLAGRMNVRVVQPDTHQE